MKPILSFSIKTEHLNIEAEEVLRYLGYKRSEIKPSDIELAQNSIRELLPSIAAKGCYGRFPIELFRRKSAFCTQNGSSEREQPRALASSSEKENEIAMPYGNIISRDLTRNLRNCKEIFLVAITIGPAFDRALRRAEARSISKAALCQAVGAAAVEAALDVLNEGLRKEVESEGFRLRPRYSPGFGDYGLEQQVGIFSVLKPEKHAGITLMDSLIMAPEKSVTAVIGIEG